MLRNQFVCVIFIWWIVDFQCRIKGRCPVWASLLFSEPRFYFWQCLFCHQDASINRLGRNEV